MGGPGPSQARRALAPGARAAVAVFALLAAASALALRSRDAPGGARPPRPDVLLLLVDALRRDHLGIYGYPRATSPELDRFARSALVYEQTLSPSSWTLPAVASVLTGVYPSQHGLRIDEIDHRVVQIGADQSTLAEQFRARGYRTLALVTNPYLLPERGFARGFDEYRLLPASTPAAELNRLAQQGLENGDGRPVFLFLHYMDVHGPYGRAPRLDRAALGPIAGDRELSAQEQALVPGYLRLAGASTLGDYVHAYDCGIRSWDAAFGVFARWLESHGRLERTWLAVIADHGEEFLDHGGWNHGRSLFSEMVNVPFVLRAPEGRGRRLIPWLESLVDIAPTLLQAAGLELPEGMAGWSVLDPGWGPGTRSIYSESGAPGWEKFVPPASIEWAVRRGKRSLIAAATGDRFAFDRARDPGEQSPLPGTDPELRADLERWMSDTVRRGRRAETRALGAAESAELGEKLKALGYAE